MKCRYLSIILLIFFGCKPIEPVNFIEIKDVKINRSRSNDIFLSAQIILENPNKIKITIDKIDIDIYAEDIILVTINDGISKTLKENSESTINIEGQINIANLETFLNEKGLALILGNGDVSLNFKGKILAKAYGIKEEIDVNYIIDSVKGLIK